MSLMTRHTQDDTLTGVEPAGVNDPRGHGIHAVQQGQRRLQRVGEGEVTTGSTSLYGSCVGQACDLQDFGSAPFAGLSGGGFLARSASFERCVGMKWVVAHYSRPHMV